MTFWSSAVYIVLIDVFDAYKTYFLLQKVSAARHDSISKIFISQWWNFYKSQVRSYFNLDSPYQIIYYSRLFVSIFNHDYHNILLSSYKKWVCQSISKSAVSMSVLRRWITLPISLCRNHNYWKISILQWFTSFSTVDVAPEARTLNMKLRNFNDVPL